MANWYDKYMTIYGKPFSEVPQRIIDETRERLAALQSPEPLASIVVIGYNEERHLQACLWAISEIRCKYPVEIIGVDNDSKDRTAEIYEKSGIPYYTEYQHSCGYARRCGLQHSKGRFYFDVDSDTLYPPGYYEIMLEHLLKPGVSCVSATWSYFLTRITRNYRCVCLRWRATCFYGFSTLSVQNSACVDWFLPIMLIMAVRNLTA